MQMTVPRPREQALEQIMAYILENKLSADDKLPPEREMCQMWGVNRCTLRSAIAALTEQGIVYAVQGSGTRIAHRFRRILQDLQGFSEYAADCGLRPETRLKITGHLVASLLLLLSWLTALQTLCTQFSQPESSASAASPLSETADFSFADAVDALSRQPSAQEDTP